MKRKELDYRPVFPYIPPAGYVTVEASDLADLNMCIGNKIKQNKGSLKQQMEAERLKHSIVKGETNVSAEEDVTLSRIKRKNQ